MFIGFWASAQVAIGKTEVDGVSALLDFENSSNNTNGIILPSVDDVQTLSLHNGTFAYDRASTSVKMYENGNWVDVTDSAATLPSYYSAPSASEVGQGVIIGKETSSAEGVLVLESDDKALILPHVFRPHDSVEGPYPGMICYDTESKSLAVFDGANWHYWK